MYAAAIEPSKIAQVLGLRRKVTSMQQLDQQVEAGLPKASLGAVARHVYGTSPDAAALMQRVIPSATFHRRGEDLKAQEGERVERLARVIATAEHVWDSVDDARAFLSTGHAMLGGKRPIEVALTELGARRVENLLWSLFHGVAAKGLGQGAIKGGTPQADTGAKLAGLADRRWPVRSVQPSGCIAGWWSVEFTGPGCHLRQPFLRGRDAGMPGPCRHRTGAAHPCGSRDCHCGGGRR